MVHVYLGTWYMVHVYVPRYVHVYVRMAIHVFEIMLYLYTCTHWYSSTTMVWHTMVVVHVYQWYVRTTYVRTTYVPMVHVHVYVLEYHGMYRYHTYTYIPITGYRLPWYTSVQI